MNEIGILLMAGSGRRLLPLTAGVNKALLPIYKQSLAQNAVQALTFNGVEQIIVVCREQESEQIEVHLRYTTVNPMRLRFVGIRKTLGTGHSVYLCRSLVGRNPIAVYMVDNVFQRSQRIFFDRQLRAGSCHVLLAQTLETRHFGFPHIVNDRIVSIVDKPSLGTGRGLVCTGAMRFSTDYFVRYKSLSWPIGRERDIMDVVRLYLTTGDLSFDVANGEWRDAGVNPDSLLDAALLARQGGLNR
jgi:glucose-1-phosphate thymidylyltransferase